MWTKQLRLWRLTLCILFCMSSLAITARGEEHVPSESECRPYIEKALHKVEHDSSEKQDSLELSTDNDSKEGDDDNDASVANDSKEDDSPSVEVADEPYTAKESIEDSQADNDSKEGDGDDDDDTKEGDDDSKEADDDKDGDSKEDATAEDQTAEEDDDDQDDAKDGDSKEVDDGDSKEVADDDNDSKEQDDDESASRAKRSVEDDGDDSTEKSDDNDDDGSQEKAESNEDNDDDKEDSKEQDDDDDTKSAADDDDSAEKAGDDDDDKSKEEEGNDDDNATKEDDDDNDSKADDDDNDSTVDAKDDDDSKADDKDDDDSKADDKDDDDDSKAADDEDDSKGDDDGDESEGDDDDSEEGTPEEELLLIKDIPENLRSRDHLVQILRLDDEADEAEQTIERSAEIILRDLKRIYENNIKPLETLYKYRDLSNRHFGDPEIFSKPLVLFMGPWSGGKSSILNYLTDLEFTEWSLRTGAEPSPAYFNILMHGKEPEVLDGTQLAADWTFSGLQKFGQGLEERLRGLKYPSKLLEKVNIVEIPGILEVRKQVSRVFPFNDACQWFIDRADIIFLVYDPSKLDVGPETEAILDQLKGRESQTRIVLNKADTVKPEELMRVQSALIWNISPLMSSPQPPVMYTVSLWSMPFESGAPSRLLQAQERELLRDLRGAVDKRIENKIASARRFAVRVRNHAKMVDCYLTTYFNHKTIFGNKKLIADAIIENPQTYHIYEGLSTLTNISRYDLPDPETYRDFFRLNPLYEFQQLSATCTYFRGCPITKLDVAIAYDLPELVGKYKKMVETVTPQGMPKS